MEEVGQYFQFGKADVFRAPEIVHRLFAVLEQKRAKALLLLFGEACVEVIYQLDVKPKSQILYFIC